MLHTLQERHEQAQAEMTVAANKASHFRGVVARAQEQAAYWEKVEDAARTVAVHLSSQLNQAERVRLKRAELRKRICGM